MDIAEEKQFIYTMMKDIVAERRKLTDTYYDLKKRLETLDELEEKGIRALSINGYSDFKRQQDEQRIASNVEREALRVVESMRNHSNPEQQSLQLFAKEEVAKQPKPDHPMKKKIQKEEVEKNGSKPSKRVRYSLERVESALVDILKNSDSPLTVQQMYDELCDKFGGRFYDREGFQKNVLYRIRKKNPNITTIKQNQYIYANSKSSNE